MVSKLYIGVTSRIKKKDLSLLFFDLDYKTETKLIKDTCLSTKTIYCKNHQKIYIPLYKNWLCYESKHGIHLISMNIYRLYSLKKWINYFRENKIRIDRDYVNYFEENNYFTLRISKKPNEERKLLFYNVGLFPISESHFCLYSLLFPEIYKYKNKHSFHDFGLELIGYKHYRPKKDDLNDN